MSSWASRSSQRCCSRVRSSWRCCSSLWASRSCCLTCCASCSRAATCLYVTRRAWHGTQNANERSMQACAEGLPAAEQPGQEEQCLHVGAICQSKERYIGVSLGTAPKQTASAQVPTVAHQQPTTKFWRSVMPSFILRALSYARLSASCTLLCSSAMLDAASSLLERSSSVLMLGWAFSSAAASHSRPTLYLLCSSNLLIPAQSLSLQTAVSHSLPTLTCCAAAASDPKAGLSLCRQL